MIIKFNHFQIKFFILTDMLRFLDLEKKNENKLTL